MKTKHSRLLPPLMLFCLLAARPLPSHAEIIFSTSQYSNPSWNPAPSAAQINLVWQAVRTLANDPALANHPIRNYFRDPNIKAEIIFDNLLISSGARTYYNSSVFIRSDLTLGDYLYMLAHEFIHVGVNEKYNQTMDYSFLLPEDSAFIHVMQEAFAKTTDAWVRLHYPQETNSDMQIRNWVNQSRELATIDAMRNDLRAQGYDSEQIENQVIEQMFKVWAFNAQIYTLEDVPNSMRDDYGRGNTFLIPEYAAYRQRGDALARHMWDYLASIVPYKLPAYMTYDTVRNMFKNTYTFWAKFAEDPQNSVLYWVNYDYEAAARARIAAQKPEDMRYKYLPREDEARLNAVFREIDPTFRPVDTWRTMQRILQEERDLIQRRQQTTGTQGNPIPLDYDAWKNGSISASTSGGAVWYSFTAASGTAYDLWWNDRDRDSSKLDVMVDAMYQNGASIFSSADSGWPRSFTASRSGTVLLKVYPYSSGGTGSFSIAYNRRPQTTASSSSSSSSSSSTGEFWRELGEAVFWGILDGLNR
jgi:hypothetical protein